jgi:molybdenum cofactor cytidylyltransferase
MIPAIVLAAGESRRMGRLKPLLLLENGETFLARILRTLREAGVQDAAVVVGHQHQDILAATGEVSGVRFVINREYGAGQLTSLVAGLRVIDRPGVAAALVTLVDVPLVRAATVSAVVDRYHQTLAPIVRPVRGLQHGHPVLIDRSLFDAVYAADPTVGVRAVVRSHASPAGEIEIDDDGAFRDIDTPHEYERALAELRAK